MKLRCLFSGLLASVLLLTGCVQEQIGQLEEIKLSKTYLSIPQEGGQVEVTLTASGKWSFVETEVWPRVIEFAEDADGKKIEDENSQFGYVIDEEKTEQSWLVLSEGPMSGDAGEFKLVFSAEEAIDGRSIEIAIQSGTQMQYLRVCQGNTVVTEATCKEIIEGPDGKTYRVTGVCKKISNTLYGNWYLADDTGEVYIYGTLDKDGAPKNFESWEMEEGDVVTVEGPKLTYGSTVELVDVTVLNIEKSLIKITETPKSFPKEGGEFVVKLEYKGDGVQPSISEEVRDWVSIVDVATRPGEPTKLDPNPASIAEVTFKLLANESGAREGKITFASSKKVDDELATSSVDYVFSQEGSIAEVTVAEFLEKEVGKSLFKLTGKVTKLKTGDYGNFHLEDATGSVYVYGLTATPVEKNDKSFPTLGIKEGDIVTLIGTRAQYAAASNEAEKEQVGGPAYYVSHIGSTVVTVAEFLTKEVDSNVRYRLTGEITNLKTGDYGNFHLKDETGSVYVYGLTKAPVAKNDKSFPSLGLKEGDIVTLVGTRDRYDSAKVPEEKEQVGGPAYYISHVAGEGGEQPETPAEPTVATVAEFLAAAEDDTIYELSGTISEITTAYSEQHGNISFKLTDETETVLIFRMSCEGIENPSAIAVGDKVTVQGTRGSYNGAAQMAAGSKCVSYTAGDEPDEPETPVLADGNYWIVGTKDGETKAMLPIEGRDYGYAPSELFVNNAGYADNAFTFRAVEGGYTIQDPAGKYYYQDAGTTYKTFSVGTDGTKAGCVWVITKNDDQTYTIQNAASEKYLRYAEGSYTSFGVYAESEFNGSVTVSLVDASAATERPVFALEASAASVGSDVTTYSITVESNVAWTAAASTGVTLDKASGEGDATVVMTFAANQTAEAVNHTVTFSPSGLEATVFTLTQKAAPVAGEEVLLDENFSSLKTWSSTTVNTLQVNGMTWTTAGGTMYGQDGCIKFGKGQAAANVGVKLPKLTALTSATNVTLTFKAVSSDAAYKLKVSATGGATVGTLTPAAITKHSAAINSGADTKTQLQAAFDASTSSFSVTIENVTADTEITIVADGSAKRWYFDDVKIVKAGAADTGSSSSLPIEDWQTSSYSK